MGTGATCPQALGAPQLRCLLMLLQFIFISLIKIGFPQGNKTILLKETNQFKEFIRFLNFSKFFNPF